jgi:glycosyltransferase involved in cell wall biosynthesis
MKANTEIISVVIPLYNKAPFILRAIHSVLGQTKSAGEIIVIDDGSTDGGGDLVDQLQNPFIRLIRQENKGVSVARNVGISLANGDLIAFLDADDEWKPKFLEVISEMRQLYPHAGAYAAAFDIITTEGKRILKKFKGISACCEHQLIGNIFSVDIDPALIWTSAVVVPKYVFGKVGYFKEGEYLAQDVDMWVRIGIFYPVAFNSTVLGTYHKEAFNRSYGVKKFRHEPAFSITISESLKLGIVPAEKIEGLKEYGAYWRYWAVRQLIENGMKDLSIKIINETKGTKRFYMHGQILLILAHLPPFFMRLGIKTYRKIFIDWKSIIKNYKRKLNIVLINMIAF